MSITLDSALDYLRRGWLPVLAYGVDGSLCNCRKGANCTTPGKHPIHDQWHARMPTETQVRDWFDAYPDSNIGVAMGPMSGIIDIETDDEAGEEWVANLWNGNAPATAMFKSGRSGGGGVHRLYRFRADLPRFGNKAVKGDGRHVADLKLGLGVDEKTGLPKGSQSIFPPSMHASGRRYEWIIHPDDTPPAELPDWVAVKLVDMFRPAAPPPPVPTFANAADAVKRCRAFVATKPPAVSGQRGHDATFNVACEIVRFGLGDDDALAVLAEFNSRCQPPWTEKELRHKLTGARATVLDPGSRLAENRNSPVVNGVDLSGIIGGQGKVEPIGVTPANGSEMSTIVDKSVSPMGDKSVVPIGTTNNCSHSTRIEPFRPFPVNELPPLAAEFIVAAAESIDVDPCKVAVAVLGTASGAIGNSCRIRPKPDYSEPAMLWLASVAYSGDRKSPALDRATSPIRRRDGEEIRRFREASAQHDEALLKYKSELKNWEKEQGKNSSSPSDPPQEPEAPVERRFVIEDCTVEKLAAMMQANPRGMVRIQDELAGYFQSQNQYKSGLKGSDESDYLNIFGGRPWRKDRKVAGGSVYVPMPYLSIVGTIQPAILQRCLTRDRLDSGMAARFLLAWPPPRASSWSESFVGDELQSRYATTIERLLRLPLDIDPTTDDPLPAMLPMTRAAKALFIPWHDQHERDRADMEGPLAAAWSKLTGYALRLALVVELLRWAEGSEWQPPEVVGDPAMAAGIALSEWFASEALRVYGLLNETDEQKERRELVEYIGRHGGRITARDLAHGPRRYRGNSEAAEAALVALVKAGAGEWINIPTTKEGGRPCREFRLPEIGAAPGGRGPRTPIFPAENGGSGASTIETKSNSEVQEWTF